VTVLTFGSGLGNLGTEYLSEYLSSEHRPVLMTIPQRSNLCSYFPVLSFVKNCCLNCCTREKMAAQVDLNLKWKKIAAMVYHFLMLPGFLPVLIIHSSHKHSDTHTHMCQHADICKQRQSCNFSFIYHHRPIMIHFQNALGKFIFTKD